MLIPPFEGAISDCQAGEGEEWLGSVCNVGAGGSEEVKGRRLNAKQTATPESRELLVKHEQRER